MVPSSIILPRNVFAYPGRMPGFDPTHPATANRVADGPILSCVALGSNFLAFLKGVTLGTPTGTPTAAFGAGIGPGVKFTSTQVVTFTIASSTINSSFTCAAIFLGANGGTSAQGLIGTNSTGNSIRVAANTNAFAVKVGAGAAVSTGVTAAAGFPYFFAFSSTGVNTGAQAYVITNLDTGQIFFGTPAANANGPGAQTTIIIGNNSAGTAPVLNPIACGMFANSLLSLQTLLAWAADPWSFWYPSKSTFLVGVTSAAFKAAWALNRNFINKGVAT